MNPLVSVIMPVYNAEAYIKDALTSVTKQTYTYWELILIDDASTDAGFTRAKTIASQHANIILLKNRTNKGPAYTRNKALKYAKGTYIAFLDADDVWVPKKLEKQLAFMQTHKTDICFSSYELINEGGKPLNKQVQAFPVLTYKKLLKANYIGNLTGIYNAQRLGKIKSINLAKRQDWVMWLQAVKKTTQPVLGIQESLAYYRVRKNSVSSNKLKLVKYNYLVYRKGLNYSVLKSIKFLMSFFYEQFFVKAKQLKQLN